MKNRQTIGGRVTQLSIAAKQRLRSIVIPAKRSGSQNPGVHWGPLSLAVLALTLGMLSSSAFSQSQLPEGVRNVGIDQRLNELAAAHRKPFDPNKLPFTTVNFTKDHKAIRFVVDSTRYGIPSTIASRSSTSRLRSCLIFHFTFGLGPNV